MRGFYAVAVAASLFVPCSFAFISEELSAIAAGEQPGRTEVYIQRMRAAKGKTLNADIDRSNWDVSADSFEAGFPASNAIDGDAQTFWETKRNPSVSRYPHSITVDMKETYWVTGVTYLPRQDGSTAGTAGRHSIELSRDGINFGSAKAFGVWHDDSYVKTANFSATQARYVRLRALNEAAGNVAYTTAADINVYTVDSYSPPNPATQGAYGPTIGFPTVLVAATVLHGSGKVMGWSSYLWDQFTPVAGHGTTWTTTYDPASGEVSDAVITNTQHDMFCPGLSRDALGRAIVTGGSNSYAVSRYDDLTEQWTAMPKMTTPRGYQGQCTLSDGRIFTIGGSFSGGQSLKNGEVYSPATNTWKALSGCDAKAMLTNDAAGIYRADNHAWLFGWRGGSAFQAGPSKAMNWYTTNGQGSTNPAGNRGNDGDAMNGNAAMYDGVQGLILATGGAPSYENNAATSNANIIQIGKVNTKANVTQIGNMRYPRSFASSVVLPGGSVLISGGQSYPICFTDSTPVMTPELFDPRTNKFTELAPLATIRNYHSIALLLPDASVLIGGGGLCGNCSTNKFDAQVYYPPYLYASDGSSAKRPSIQSISSSKFRVGATMTLSTGSPIDEVDLIRYGSATHAINTDQRRVPIKPKKGRGNTYTVTIPNDAGIMTPGAWMVFVLTKGVPSVSKTIMIAN